MAAQVSRWAMAQPGWRAKRLYWPVSDDHRESLVADESPFKGKTGLRRVWNAFHYSRAGLGTAYRAEDAFRQEVLLTAVLVPLAFLLSPNGVGLALMIGSLLLVLIVELLNSAIEAVVDRVSLEQHPLAKRAKDIGSAAVLLALLNAVAVWGCVLLG
jgi:diacylglycerol kinase (ATP)